MRVKSIFFLSVTLFITSLVVINSKNIQRQNNINHYQNHSEENTVRLVVNEKGTTSCEVESCGFTQFKTSCAITCNGAQTAKCSCNCIKTTTFGTCLELRESCKCEKD